MAALVRPIRVVDCPGLADSRDTPNAWYWSAARSAAISGVGSTWMRMLQRVTKVAPDGFAIS